MVGCCGVVVWLVDTKAAQLMSKVLDVMDVRPLCLCVKGQHIVEIEMSVFVVQKKCKSVNK